MDSIDIVEVNGECQEHECGQSRVYDPDCGDERAVEGSCEASFNFYSEKRRIATLNEGEDGEVISADK